MTTIQDVAAYIVREFGALRAMKLHRLLFYCQAWHLVWEDTPLFEEDFEAWSSGPICRELYRNHRLAMHIRDWPYGDATRLKEEEEMAVDAVLAHYGRYTGRELCALVHRAPPWKDTFRESRESNAIRRTIPKDLLQRYYSSAA